MAVDHRRGVTSCEELIAVFKRFIAQQRRVRQRYNRPIEPVYTEDGEARIAAAIPAIWDAYERWLDGEVVRFEQRIYA